jgi:hypothetical protein
VRRLAWLVLAIAPPACSGKAGDPPEGPDAAAALDAAGPADAAASVDASLPCTSGDGNMLGADDHCYMRFDSGATWVAAKAACVALVPAAHLATITSGGEQQLVHDLVAGREMWIGLSDTVTEGTFEWVTGEPLAIEVWAANQPDNANGKENCVEVTGVASRWNDHDCVATLGYVCERD